MNNENKNSNLENTDNKIGVLPAEPEYATVTQLNVEASMRASNDQMISDSFKLKLNEIDSKFDERISSLEDNKIQPKIMPQGDEEDNYATVTQLNVEASMRADNDQIICDRYDEKFGEIDNKFIKDGKKLDSLEGKVEVSEKNIETHEERISSLEGGIWDQVRQLEQDKKDLEAKLEEANKTIDEKEEQIKELQEELGTGNNYINLKFSTPPEYTVTEIMNVKDFINQNIKELVVSKMTFLYPETTLGKDYTVVIDGLSYDDVMQGKIVSIIVKALDEGKLIGESTFDIKVTYNYNVQQQKRFIEELLQPAIPTSLRNVTEDKSPDYNVPQEIAKTRPLKLLLNNRDYKHFVFKIFTEMNAASYWTDFHRTWGYNVAGFVGTKQSTIGGKTKDQIINSINELAVNTQGYHNSIYRFLERLINDSGVSCTVTKKVAKSKQGMVLHNVGNLIFDVPNANLYNNEIIFTQNRAHYMMINFEINFTDDEVKNYYRGVTIALSDKLELYPDMPV